MRCVHLRKMYKLVVVMNFVLTVVVTGVMADAYYDHSENITADGQWQYLNGLTIMKMIVANILQIAF